MKYGYVVYANLKSQESFDELPAEMDRIKEHAKSHGFHMKYWGHPYGVSESIMVVYKSEKTLGEFMKMTASITVPFEGARTIIAAKN